MFFSEIKDPGIMIIAKRIRSQHFSFTLGKLALIRFMIFDSLFNFIPTGC
jgi:hypothetical protein